MYCGGVERVETVVGQACESVQFAQRLAAGFT